MKKILFTLFLLFVFLLFSVPSFAASSFTYELDANGDAIITSYTGTDTDIIIPNIIDDHNVKSINSHAFNESRNTTNGKILTSVKISEGITTVGDFAFIGCINLEKVTLPESLTSLGMQTFIGCSKLNKINIPSNLKQFKNTLFQETAFSEFTIPEWFETIETSTFRLCRSLKSIKVYSDNVTFGDRVFEYCSDDLVLYGHENSSTQRYAEANGLTFRLLSDTPSDVPVTSISLNKNSISLSIGQSETLIATVLPSNATNKNIIWSSSNEHIATVENGNVVAKSVGTSTITVKLDSNENIKSTCVVTVLPNNNTPSEIISLNKTNLSLKIGDSETLVASTSSNSSSNLTWSSSNQTVATVENGIVTAKSVGTALITVTLSDDVKASCTVTVTKKSNVTTPPSSSNDNTTSGGTLPNTGNPKILLFFLLIFSSTSFFISYIYKRKLKDI